MTAAPVVVLGPTASGKSDVAMAAARAVAGTEIVAVDAMQVYRGMDIGTAKPSPADRRAVRHHGIDLVGPDVDFTVADYRRGYDDWTTGIAGHPLLVAGTGLYLNAVIDRLDVPGQWPDGARGAATGRHRRPAGDRLTAARPLGGGTHRPRQPPPHRAGAGGHARQRTSVQLVRPRRRGATRRRTPCCSACAGRGTAWPTASSGASPRCWRPGSSPRWPASRRRGCRGRPARRSGTRSCSPTSTGRSRSTTPWRRSCCAPASSPVRQERWFRRDPRVRWFDIEHDPVAEVAPAVVAALHA